MGRNLPLSPAGGGGVVGVVWAAVGRGGMRRGGCSVTLPATAATAIRRSTAAAACCWRGLCWQLSARLAEVIYSAAIRRAPDIQLQKIRNVPVGCGGGVGSPKRRLALRHASRWCRGPLVGRPRGPRCAQRAWVAGAGPAARAALLAAPLQRAPVAPAVLESPIVRYSAVCTAVWHCGRVRMRGGLAVPPTGRRQGSRRWQWKARHLLPPHGGWATGS